MLVKRDVLKAELRMDIESEQILKDRGRIEAME